MLEEFRIYKDTRYHITKYGNKKKNAHGYLWEVSNFGRVKRDGQLIEFKTDDGGYKVLGHYYLHRMVAEVFIPNPDNKPQVDHINTIRTDNRVDNLRWVTQSENNLNPITNQRQIKAAINRTNTAWNKGLTKETDERVLRGTIKMINTRYVGR